MVADFKNLDEYKEMCICKVLHIHTLFSIIYEENRKHLWKRGENMQDF